MGVGSDKETPSSSQAKRGVLQYLLLECLQTVKVVVKTGKLGDEHGFPVRIISAYPDKLVIDLRPSWVRDMTFSNSTEFVVGLSFGGSSSVCRIPWRAIDAIGVGFGDVKWEHERDETSSLQRLRPARGRRSERPRRPRRIASHLRPVPDEDS